MRSGRNAGLSLRFPNQPFFNEVLVKLDRPIASLIRQVGDAGYLAGYDVGSDYPELSDCLLIAVTEKRSRAEIDALVDLLAGLPVSMRPKETGHDADQFVTRDLSE